MNRDNVIVVFFSLNRSNNKIYHDKCLLIYLNGLNIIIFLPLKSLYHISVQEKGN